MAETGYDGEGHVISQTDGNKHTTSYTRNILGQVTDIEDPLKHKTTKEYDAAGNLSKLTDPAKRTSTYKYDPANQLTEVKYSDEATPTVKYEYDADGDRTGMEDGTGTSKYSYDQLDRLTESKDGHGNVVKYEYDLANQQTKITYPNGKAVSREYDNAGRLEKITDWLEHTTSFSYDTNSNQTKTTFPGNEDTYTYNEADQLTKTEMNKGAESLASLTYARDPNGQLESTTQKGLPGAESTSYSYDENNRLTKGGTTEYKYDEADNPTKTGSSTNTFNEGDELTEATGVKYSYDELGQRTKRTPTEGQATTYSYDQAGNLTKAERAKEGEAPAIEDSYAYDGNGLRASQTISGTTSYLAWDVSGSLPLLINDGANSYIYGPSGLPVEQISSGGTVLYLHHDQQASTRLLTTSTGAKEASFSYDAYGNQTEHTGTATTPLGYDGQYTSSDTGLIYLRARTYDPATPQPLSVDPLAVVTRSPYGYAYGNPVTYADPLGLWPGEGLLRSAVDVIAVVPYGAYYFSYQAARGINAAGAQFGPAGSSVSHVLAAPLAVPEAAGLTLDAGIDALKNEAFGNESICDEGTTGFLNPLHSFVPRGIDRLAHPLPPFVYRWLEGPRAYLPGIHADGSVDFEW